MVVPSATGMSNPMVVRLELTTRRRMTSFKCYFWGSLKPSEGPNGTAQGGTAAHVCPPTSPADAERSPSPRLQTVLARLGLSTSAASTAGIFTCEAALEASDDAFGEYSEDVRIFAGDALSQHRPA